MFDLQLFQEYILIQLDILQADLERPVELWGEDALLQWPGARRALIQERDAYMARTIWAAATGAFAVLLNRKILAGSREVCKHHEAFGFCLALQNFCEVCSIAIILQACICASCCLLLDMLCSEQHRAVALMHSAH